MRRTQEIKQTKEITMATPALRPASVSRALRLARVLLLALPLPLFLTAPGTAAAAAPRLQISVAGEPTNFAPGDSSGNDAFYIDVTNVGDAPTDGSDVQINDTLPAGLTPTSVDLFLPAFGPSTDVGAFACTYSSVPTQCTIPGSFAAIPPGQTFQMRVHVTVGSAIPDGTELTDSASVSGGGAAPASADWQTPISSSTPAFGTQAATVAATNQDATPDAAAGSHPYDLETNLHFNTVLKDDGHGNQIPAPVADAKDVQFDLPPGLIGNPQAVPECPIAQFQINANGASCPADSQIGTVTLDAGLGCDHCLSLVPLYNLQPQPGTAAQLGFLYLKSVPITLTASVRTGGDYGLRVTSSGIPQVALNSVSVTIWGVPSDPSHDGLRGASCDTTDSAQGCASPGGLPSGAAAKPFLRLPTACSGKPVSVAASAESWQQPDATQTTNSTMPAMTGCDALGAFNPSIAVAPDSSEAGAPAGLAVDIKVPQTDDPNQAAPPDVRDVTVALPAGMTVNPSGADGLASCSDAQFAVSSPDPSSCPDASKIGTVSLHTPLLDHSLPGDVYVGSPQCSPCSPQDAASGKLLRLFIEVNDPVSGVVVKLPGTVSVDQSTGQLTSTFLQNPQLPFDELQLQLKGGARAPLVNPESCGTYTTTSDFVPWSSPLTLDATPSSSFDVSSGCGIGSSFAPSFSAGVSNAQAGAHSAFVLSFQRSDADQAFSGLAVKLPPGLSAKLAGVPLCSNSDAAAGTCPAGSKIGDVRTGAGAGSQPLFLPGQAFLTGPYKGAPYGMAVVVPAVAGPYNLGTVVVRQALYVDPTNAQVTAVSDPFPTQLDGIPLRIRRVDVNLDRSGFITNPTSCDPMSIGAVLSSTGGRVAGVSSRFQVGGCQDLGFSPKLAFKLTGNGQTHSGTHPTLTATLTQFGGQANIKSTQVALPLSLALDPNNSNHVCNYQVAAAVHGGNAGCPASTIVGYATAITPLLSQPLNGPVYLVQGLRCQLGQPSPKGTCPNGQAAIRTYPTLLLPLRGQIAIDLRTQGLKPNAANQLVTTFPTIPDAPVNRFTLTINGGPKGLLVITGRGQTICSKPQIANANFGAQSGKTNNQNDTISTPCGQAASLEHSTVQRGAVHVTIHIPGAGKLHASGRWLNSQTRLFGKAQTANLDLSLTNAAVNRLHHKRPLQTQVILNWTPVGGGTHPMQTRTLTIRP